MTAWLGAVHALQRQLQNLDFEQLRLQKVAVSCHAFDLQTYKGKGDFVHSIVGTANPLDKDGSRPAFIEEARCHLEVSLLIEFKGFNPDTKEKLHQAIHNLIPTMKFASGDVLSVQAPQFLEFKENEDETPQLKKITNRLMLGHVLVERRDLLKDAMQNEGKDGLDALLDYLKVTHTSSMDDQQNVTWTSQRKTAGWLVPIAVGFQGISELGIAKNQRDSNTPHRFAEAVVTLGEFVMPYRVDSLDCMLWQYHVDLDNNLYLCQTTTP